VLVAVASNHERGGAYAALNCPGEGKERTQPRWRGARWWQNQSRVMKMKGGLNRPAIVPVACMFLRERGARRRTANRRKGRSATQRVGFAALNHGRSNGVHDALKVRETRIVCAGSPAKQRIRASVEA